MQIEKIDQLKDELALLEGKKSPAPVPEPAPVRSGVFDALLAAENRDRQERQKADAMNAKFKSCCDCYFTQPVIETVCSLCGTIPLMWLPATERPENRELDGLRTMAAEYSIEQLGVALRSGWCSNRPERERVAKNILAARIRQRDINEVRNKVSAATKEYEEQSKRQPEVAPRQRARELSSVYDRQLAAVRERMAELNGQMLSSERSMS